MCDKNSKTSEWKRITGPGTRVTSLRAEKSYRTPPVFGTLRRKRKIRNCLLSLGTSLSSIKGNRHSRNRRCLRIRRWLWLYLQDRARRDVNKTRQSLQCQTVKLTQHNAQTVAVELGADDGESDPPIQLKRLFSSSLHTRRKFKVRLTKLYVFLNKKINSNYWKKKLTWGLDLFHTTLLLHMLSTEPPLKLKGKKKSFFSVSEYQDKFTNDCLYCFEF